MTAREARRVGIRIACRADGVPTSHAGRWLKAANIENGSTMADLETTANEAEAMLLTPGDALEFMRAVSRTRPRRPDGRPNRPMMGWTVELAPLDAERHVTIESLVTAISADKYAGAIAAGMRPKDGGER